MPGARRPTEPTALAAVTFDAAGTLFAPAEPVGFTYARIAARHGIIVAADEVERAFVAAMAAAPPLAFPGVTTPARLGERERAWWRAIVCRALGAGVPPATVDAATDELLAHYARAGAWRVFPDVHPTLAALRARGLRLGVVSNFDGRLPGLLAALGLAFDAVTWSSSAGVAKPDPAIFHRALAELGVRPAAALHVGDTPAADVCGAHAAGMRAVLLDRDGREGMPDVPVIPSLTRLVPPQT